VLGPAGSMRLPNMFMPKLMNNHGNYIVSLGNVCRWLAEKAEALGVEIYPGFAAAEVLYDDNGNVTGVATGDMGIGRDGKPNAMFTRGMELRGKYTLIGEGARGSLAKELIENSSSTRTAMFRSSASASRNSGRSTRQSTIPGLVQHSFGWPLDGKTGGGSFLYHLEDNQVAVGFVVHLNYENPWLSPFDEFQRFKTHPASARRSKAASAWPTARARLPKAVISPCRNCPSRAVC
jgi:electron-transferring-flavoprotein dehydrogenase